MIQSDSQHKPASSALGLGSKPRSSINSSNSHTHASSIFHVGSSENSSAVSSIFRVGSTRYQPQSSIMHPVKPVEQSASDATSEEAQDDKRYAYAMKVLRRKRVAGTLRGLVDEDLHNKLSENNFTSTDLHKIQIQVDQAVSEGKLSSKEARDIKYTLTNI